jgi:Fe-S cluster assembly iron-binding protein IscA
MVEEIMLDVSKEARTRAATFFNGREIQPVRVYVSSDGGCKRFALALDQQRAGDAVFELDGVTWVINAAFLQKAQPVRIDYGAEGFEITAAIDPNAGACATCQAAGKCGH